MIEVAQTPEQQDARFEAARRFAIEAARLAANTRCHNVVVLDVSGLSPVCDFFVIATGTSPRQMRTVADDLEELAQAQGYPPLNEAGREGSTWILVDCIDVVIHVFSEQARQYYDLDSLWGDARRIEWQVEPQMNTDERQ
ncbi:ribosome silencing factor [Fontivita pretiosa]|uniref:ribosome silencing factor n=1 Tax=Fontivita pretiosa TaxID=2989684 RepID=UPI003D166FF7